MARLSQQRLCVAESTGDASVATYNLDCVSNRKALGDCEFCIASREQKLAVSDIDRTHGTKDVQEVFKIRQGVDQFVKNLREGFVKCVLVYGG